MKKINIPDNTNKMASELSRLGNVYPGIKIFRQIVGISQLRRGVLFSIRYQGFSPISIVGKHFLLSTMYKSTLWVARKIPILLLVFFINRDALFRRDHLFPISFFAVYSPYWCYYFCSWPPAILHDLTLLFSGLLLLFIFAGLSSLALFLVLLLIFVCLEFVPCRSLCMMLLILFCGKKCVG